MSKGNIPLGAFLFFMSQRIYIGPGAWKERTAAGGWLFRWYDLRFSESRRRCLWDQLQDLATLHCPSCGYRWLPRDHSRLPVSCAACKRYLVNIRSPAPDGWEHVSPDEWDR